MSVNVEKNMKQGNVFEIAYCAKQEHIIILLNVIDRIRRQNY